MRINLFEALTPHADPHILKCSTIAGRCQLECALHGVHFDFLDGNSGGMPDSVA